MNNAELGAGFVRVVAPHIEQLKRTARRYARQPCDAEDLLQETVMRAWKAYPNLRPDSNMHAWLTKIMVNTWISGYRTKQRRPAEHLVDDHLDELDPANTHPSAESLALQKLHSNDTWKAVSQLPDTQRIVVYYAFIQGLKHKEIATRLGIPEGTVMSRLHRARQNLRNTLQHNVDESAA